MTTPILLTGGTGTLGRLLLPHLRAAGRPIRILTRQRPNGAPGDVEYVAGDLATGAGVAASVEGAATIVHCAGSAKGDEVKAANLLREAARAGAKHVVYISVVGADRVPVTSAMDRMAFGYFAAKRAAEVLVAESGIPWTTLRASQFHELTLATIRRLAKLPVVPVPAGACFQPVDGAEVAARFAELALGEPAGLVPDVAGPRAYGFDELVRSYLRAAGKRRPILPMPMGGGAYRAIRAGANLAPDRAVGRRTWEDFLAENI
ncbi:SDR family oxidoreductase [Dactylosporangium sp. CA-233914]|uniref:SDR family oxidoreductase n=1 Tax=Dactylosporangium sp. CA-233914 TaxID=3239934 RepID=UPI003D8E6325